MQRQQPYEQGMTGIFYLNTSTSKIRRWFEDRRKLRQHPILCADDWLLSACLFLTFLGLIISCRDTKQWEEIVFQGAFLFSWDAYQGFHCPGTFPIFKSRDFWTCLVPGPRDHGTFKVSRSCPVQSRDLGPFVPGVPGRPAGTKSFSFFLNVIAFFLVFFCCIPRVEEQKKERENVQQPPRQNRFI